MLGLIGIGAGILFSGYSQVLRSNMQMSQDITAKNDLNAAGTTLAATSTLSADALTFCPPPGPGASVNCNPGLSAQQRLVPLANLAGADSAKLPANAGAAGTGGAPVEFGVFAAGSGLKQLDPYGHFYIYCRWENTRAGPSLPAMAVISAGADGVLNSTCGDGTPQGDDELIQLSVGSAVQRSAIWQTDSSNNVYYGATGSQLRFTTSGDLNVPGSLSVTGNSVFNATGIFTGAVTAPAFNGNLVGGTVSGTAGSFSSDLAAGGTLTATGATILKGTLDAKGDATLEGALAVTGATILNGDLDAKGNTTLEGTLGVTGATVLNSTLDMKGDTTLEGALGVTGLVTGNGGFNGNLIGDVTGSITGPTGAFSSTVTVGDSSKVNITSNGDGTFAGTLTATSFSGGIDLGGGGGGGGGVTITGTIPLANGGTGYAASSNADLLTELGVLSGGYLNTGLLTAGLIPGADLVGGSVTDLQLSATGVTAGAYNWGTVSAEGRVSFAQNVNSTQLTDGSGDAITAGGGLTFTTSGVDQAFMDQNGFLGLGTLTPHTRLDVNGNIRIEGAAGSSRELQFTTGGTSKRWVVSITAENETGIGNAGSNFALNSYDDAGALIGTPFSIVRSSGAAAFSGPVSMGGALTGTSATFSGAVGIGGALTGTTADFTGTLTGTSATFSGNVTANTFIGVNASLSGTVTAANFSGNISGTLSLPDGSAAAPSLFFTSDTDTGIYWPGADVFAIAAGGKDVARFTGSTTGANYFNFGASVADGRVTLSAAGSDTDVGISLATKGSGTVLIPTGNLVFATSGAATFGKIGNNAGVNFSSKNWVFSPVGEFESSGGFAIGTNPGSVASDIFITRAAAASVRLGRADAAAPVAQTLGVQGVIAGTSDTAGADFTIAGSQSTGTGAGGSILFKTAPAAGVSGTTQNPLATAMTITGAGNVGIGTTAPAAKLEIYGGKLTVSNAAGNYGQLAVGGFAGGNVSLSYINTNGSIITGSMSNDVGLRLDNSLRKFYISAGATPQFTLDTNTGNVGINTTAPGYKLDVNGTLHVSGATAFDGGMVNTGNDTALAFIPTGSAIPVNGLYLPSANAPGMAANSIEVMQWNTLVGGTDYLSVTAGKANTAITMNAAGSANAAISMASLGSGNLTFTPGATGNFVVSSSKAMIVPIGSTAASPASPTIGMMRFNSDTSSFEGYDGIDWYDFGGEATTFAQGTVAIPGLSVDVDQSTGLFQSTTGTLSVTAEGVEAARFLNTASGVDYLTLAPGATGNPGAVTLGAGGTDSNVSIAVTPKGAGVITLSNAVTAANTLGVTGNFAVNTNKFNVTAASGNTAVAGTLGVTGATTLSSTLGVTGDLAINTIKFNVAAASGNTAIAGTLTVTGTSTFSDGTVNNGTDTALAFIPTGSGVPANGVYLPAANTVGFAANSTNMLNVTSTGIGIGTTVPGYLLTVAGASGAGSNVDLISGDGSHNGNLYFGQPASPTAGAIVYDNSSNAFRIFTNSGERVRIDSSGNVGIGTASPATKLDVSGTGHFTGAVTFDSGAIYGGLLTATAFIPTGSGVPANGVYLPAANTVGIAANSTNMLNVTSTGIGIGTTSPGVPLDIQAAVGRLRISNTTGGVNGTLIDAISDTTKGAYLHIRRDGSNEWFLQADQTANNLNFITGAVANTPMVVISSAGNVGIGTTSPTVKLDVLGRVHIWDDASVSGGVVSQSIGETNATASATSIALQVLAANSPALNILGNGNVGIGTTVPSNTLTVYGASGTSQIAAKESTSAHTIALNATTGNQEIIASSGDLNLKSASGTVRVYSAADDGEVLVTTTGAAATNVAIRANGNSYFNGGNVGIGTTAPLAPLDITTATATGQIASRLASSSGAFQQYTDVGLKDWAVGVLDSSSALTFFEGRSTGAAGTERMRIEAGGNVDIGTTIQTVYGARTYITYDGATQAGIATRATGTNLAHVIVFISAAGAAVGSIDENGSSTSYGTTSDRRLKENIAPSKEGLGMLLEIPVSDFNFIGDPKKNRVQGFIAQDLYKFYPEAVTVGGNDPQLKPWAVDYGRLTPLIIRSVQELKADNDNMRSRVAAQGREIEGLKSREGAAGTPHASHNVSKEAAVLGDISWKIPGDATDETGRTPVGVNPMLVYGFGSGIMMVVAVMGSVLRQTGRELRGLKRVVRKKAARRKRDRRDQD